MDQESVLRSIALAQVQGQLVEAIRQAAALHCYRELLSSTLGQMREEHSVEAIDGHGLARNAVTLADCLVRALGLGH